MCSLFLGGDRAWLFDGYPDDGVWKQFDVTTAAGVLREGGWRPVVTDTPTQSDADWRTRSQAGLDAELIMVNTKGNRDRFQLDPGWVLSRDVPTLDRPAAIHFVHSWSASRPASRSTIAGRFIEHGAYAYAGSVFEPYLSAFVPTPAVAQRLTAGVNFGAAVRAESGKPWRINCFGDPLLTLRRPAEGGRRANADAMPIGDFTEALTAMRKALLNREFGSGFRLAKMLGRDRDTTRLAEALLRDQPDSFGNDVARAAIMPLFREGRYDLVMQAVQRAAPNDLVNTPAGDAVWHAARQLGAGDVQPVFGVLKGMLREPHEVADAIELAGWIRSVQSPADAAAFLRGVGDVTRNDRDRSELADAIRAFGG
jgi:hypothetical protein